MKPRSLAVLVLLLAAAAILWKSTSPDPATDPRNAAAGAGETPRRDVPRAGSLDSLPDSTTPEKPARISEGVE